MSIADFFDVSVAAAVEHTRELDRVLHIPQREAEPLAQRIAAPLTARLKKPEGTMALRPMQALALAEAHDYGGLLALLPVGGGKTLISYLLPTVLGAKRPALLVPAKLTYKTGVEFTQLSAHWPEPANLQTIPFELISRQPDALNHAHPDLIIVDEVHNLKNPKAAVTRRVYRYLREHESENIRFCALSGTVADRSFADWWHIQQWALPHALQPLPVSYPTMTEWSEALDEKVRQRRPAGALKAFAPESHPEDVAAIRKGFGERLRRIPGVIAVEAPEVKASLQIALLDMDVPAMAPHFTKLRKTWCTPDDEPFSEPVDLWRHARELANGFYYRWNPKPPKYWADARSEFQKFVRQALNRSRKFDTMKQVADAYHDWPVVKRWQSVRNDFVPNNEAVWLDDTVIDFAIEWAKREQGIVWCEHTAVGDRLQQRGLMYFGEQGMSSTGQSIVDYEGAFAASAVACREGFNLQRHSQNLILNCVPKGAWLEQLLGRTHRPGQEADTVSATFLFTCNEQRSGFDQAVADAHYIQQTTGQKQKLCYADYVGRLPGAVTA